MQTLQVSWRGGVWWIITDIGAERIDRSSAALDAWLTERGATRQDLAFGGSPALQRKFVNDFGSVTAPGTGPA